MKGSKIYTKNQIKYNTGAWLTNTSVIIIVECPEDVCGEFRGVAVGIEAAIELDEFPLVHRPIRAILNEALVTFLELLLLEVGELYELGELFRWNLVTFGTVSTHSIVYSSLIWFSYTLYLCIFLFPLPSTNYNEIYYFFYQVCCPIYAVQIISDDVNNLVFGFAGCHTHQTRNCCQVVLLWCRFGDGIQDGTRQSGYFSKKKNIVKDNVNQNVFQRV